VNITFKSWGSTPEHLLDAIEETQLKNCDSGAKWRQPANQRLPLESRRRKWDLRFATCTAIDHKKYGEAARGEA
jgi:hypothetical protein